MAQAKENAKHDASPRKLKRARERGEQRASRELGGAFGLPVLLGLLALFGQDWALELGRLAREAFQGGSADLGQACLALLTRVLGWLGLAIALVSTLANLAQTGLHVQLRWDLSRLDLVKGLGRLFSRERLADLGWMLLRLALLAALAWTLRCCWSAGLFAAPPEMLDRWALAAIQSLWPPALAIAGAGLALGLLDWRLQRRRFLRQQRMSDQERKREHKEQEGDPGQKNERRRRHRELLQGSLGDLGRAKVLVINPTHLAAALRYVPGLDEEPVLLVAGRGAMAQRMRREAARLGLPMVQHVALARALMGCPVGEGIPEELFEAAAQVLRCLSEGLSGLERKTAGCSINSDRDGQGIEQGAEITAT